MSSTGAGAGAGAAAAPSFQPTLKGGWCVGQTRGFLLVLSVALRVSEAPD